MEGTSATRGIIGTSAAASTAEEHTVARSASATIQHIRAKALRRRRRITRTPQGESEGGATRRRLFSPGSSSQKEGSKGGSSGDCNPAEREEAFNNLGGSESVRE